MCLKQGGLVLQRIGHNVLKIFVNVIISTFEKQTKNLLLAFQICIEIEVIEHFLFYEIDFNLFTTIHVNFLWHVHYLNIQ